MAVVAAAAAALGAVGVAACGGPGRPPPTAEHRVDVASLRLPNLRPGPSRAAAALGIRKIKHVVFITQENRSFDTYFGTYPGADGFRRPLRKICVPDLRGKCHHPFHMRRDVASGGPHSYKDDLADVDGGRMDGFIRVAQRARSACQQSADPNCSPGRSVQMVGYYDRREIPDYWKLAQRYVLQDHFFEATDSWSFPEHLYQVSGWSAYCRSQDVRTCRSARDLHTQLSQPGKLILAWTDITYLLHAYGVSWRYYLEPGVQPDCENPAQILCPPVKQEPRKPGVWNPLPEFETVKQDHQVHNVQSTDNFFTAAAKGRLPSISWIVPSFHDSDHPPARVSDGQAWVARVVDAVMRSRDWKSTAIFLNWDDWGGYYDSVKPPRIDRFGYGLRVPALVISPYALKGRIDHQLLSTDAYLKFIEDRWLRGQTLDPRTDGRWDPRPDVREAKGRIGELARDFDFSKPPRAPRPVPVHPPGDFVDPKD